jgi:ribosomal peptide maturation radical SAM protein 1
MTDHPFRVALVSMPFAAVTRPSLGLSLLRGSLEARGIPCDIHYLNLSFAAALGFASYTTIAELSPPEALLADWIFSPGVHGYVRNEEAYLKAVLSGIGGRRLGHSLLLKAFEARDAVQGFCRDTMRRIDWSHYAVVGFSTSLQQTCSSLALAMRIKADHPHIWIVLGGANCEGEMGPSLAEAYDFVDYVCSGEADDVFPQLVDRLRHRQVATQLPGVSGRGGADLRMSSCGNAVRDLDRLPYPSYVDYFAQLRDASLDCEFEPAVPFEASRGCWWAASRPCAFCGLNGLRAGYRMKSPGRAVDELQFLSRAYGHNVMFVDNVLHRQQIDTLFPMVTERKLNLRIHCEVRPDLSKAQLRSLASAGVVHVQPGIESLRSSTLKLLGKGTIALTNVQFLKWCKELRIGAAWNLLRHVPGERCAGCRSTVALVPRLAHLDPPQSVRRVRIDRFSRYHSSPREYGITRLRPARAYKYVYPFDAALLKRLAYYFEWDSAVCVSGAAEEKLERRVAAWQQDRAAALTATIRDGALLVSDCRRAGVIREWQAPAPAGSIYGYCDEIRTRRAILDRFAGDDHPERAMQVTALLSEFVQRGLALRDEDSYLALATVIDPAGLLASDETPAAW